MNNNRKDKTALLARCKGVFSNAGFLNEGTESEYVDQKEVLRDSYKGKQFLPSCGKSGRTPDTYFGLENSKKHLYIAEDLPFEDRVTFQESQPEKPGKGFLTSDYNRRGEFTSTIRTEQYRSQLKQEERIARKRPANEAHLPLTVSLVPKDQKQEFLYDRVFDRALPPRAAQKLSRDTGNPTLLGKERMIRPCKTTYCLQFAKPPKVEVPRFGRTAIIRDTFYERDMRSDCT